MEQRRAPSLVQRDLAVFKANLKSLGCFSHRGSPPLPPRTQTDPSLLFLAGIHCQPPPAALPALSPSPVRAEGISRAQISNICLSTRGPRYRDVQKHSLLFPSPHVFCVGFLQKKLLLKKIARLLNSNHTKAPGMNVPGMHTSTGHKATDHSKSWGSGQGAAAS